MPRIGLTSGTEGICVLAFALHYIPESLVLLYYMTFLMLPALSGSARTLVLERTVYDGLVLYETREWLCYYTILSDEYYCSAKNIIANLYVRAEALCCVCMTLAYMLLQLLLWGANLDES